jgi:threonylcarbamoyladenosine tRNA methylthiotransferase MtaB
VPYVRGGIKSRPADEILAQARSFIASGTMEIVLTGIQVASYGHDTGELNFSDLIKRTAALDGLKRLRLSSIDPCAVDADFLRAICESPTLCSHFHLSLQSGCDATLERMNRKYSAAQYAKAAKELREIRPDAALTTDVIVGFPGESETDFNESLAFVREMKFAKVHVFEFSAREGTPAAKFPQQILPAEKSARGKIMRKLVAELSREFLQKQIGKTLNVLFENTEKGNSENYLSVKVKSNENLVNLIKSVKITACTDEHLTGKLI